MNGRRARRGLFSLASGTLLVLSAFPSSAGTVTWIGPDAGFWDIAGNWNPGLPGATDDVALGAVDHVIEAPCDHILERRAGAAVGYEGRIEAEFRIEHEARDMRNRADTGMAVTQFR